MSEKKDPVELYVDLPNHWLAQGGETLWGEPLGGSDQYKIINIPHFAYGLNLGDQVYALPKADGEKPTILKVVKPSDNTTLRLCFLTTPIDADQQNAVIDQLEEFKVEIERANDRMLSLSLNEANYDQACDYLELLAEQEVIELESCEVRVANSFDDVPPQH